MKKRIQACIHLTNYLLHPLLFISFMIACSASLSLALRTGGVFPSIQQSGAPINPPAGRFAVFFLWYVLGVFIASSTIAAWIYPLATLRASGMGVSKNISSLFVLFFIGCGFSFNNTIEAIKAIFTNKRWAFARTPKYSLERAGDSWVDKRYQISVDFVTLGELLLVCLGLSAMACAALRTDFGQVAVILPYTVSFGFVSFLGIRQSRRGQGRCT